MGKQHATQNSDCLFCASYLEKIIICEYHSALAAEDHFPVTPGHLLIFPKRHVVDFFDLEIPELNDIHYLLNKMRNRILKEDFSVTGFNIGVNCGESAGQTIMHAHVHLIPRREGDVTDPRGGVRGVIPGKMSY